MIPENDEIGLNLFVSDNHPGLKAARKAVYSEVPWQRCQFHLQQNAQNHITKQSRKEPIAREIRSIFNAEDLEAAKSKMAAIVEKYSTSQPKLAAWMEENIPEALTIMSFPEAHRKGLRTTNPLERLNREIKRRTRVVLIFPNESSLERLISAFLMEQDDEWRAQQQPYLTFQN